MGTDTDPEAFRHPHTRARPQGHFDPGLPRSWVLRFEGQCLGSPGPRHQACPLQCLSTTPFWGCAEGLGGQGEREGGINAVNGL